jgi:dTDP-4-amino-4,6-dideoxy-D-galactose acyltransferase
MINELVWDSDFFRKKIGELKVGHEPFSRIEAALKRAKARGFLYIICKTELHDIGLIRFLESSGFYLSDVGITWSATTGKSPHPRNAAKEKMKRSPVVATVRDIPMLKKITKSLFRESRFYNDPFFSREAADRLYLTWIENSVKGPAADVVFCVPGEGFITCKKSGRSGKIVLIGVKKASRSKGTGTALVEEAMRWFAVQGLRSASVRTQLRNSDAMNFYLKCGFSITAHDVVLSKIL